MYFAPFGIKNYNIATKWKKEEKGNNPAIIGRM